MRTKYTVVALATTLALAGCVSHPGAANRADEARSTVTAASDGTVPSGFKAWALQYNEELTDMSNDMSDIDGAAGAAAKAGDISDLRGQCRFLQLRAAHYLRSDPVTDDDAPTDVVMWLTLQQQAAEACVNGDYSESADLLNESTEAIQRITARMEALL